VGDVVIVKDDQTKRLFWKLAKVVELLISKDGNTQAAVVQVSTSKGTTQLLQRSLKHLFPIEVLSQPRENTATEERVNDLRAGQNHEGLNLDNQHQTEPSQGLRRSKKIASRVETEL